MEEQAEQRKNLPIQSNAYENWPDGPAVSAQAAILMDVNSGAVLYEKNSQVKHYPASITKVMTVMVALENSKLDEMVYSLFKITPVEQEQIRLRIQ